MKIVRSDAIKGFEIHFWYICPDHVSEERGQEKYCPFCWFYSLVLQSSCVVASTLSLLL